jgi:hypothetical protein
MLLLNHPLFSSDSILSEFKKLPTTIAGISALDILQDKLRAIFFQKNKTHLEILKDLETPRFQDYPRLKFVLQNIFSNQIDFHIPHHLKDWQPNSSFHALNHQYQYFNQDLSTLYQRLSIRCHQMTQLVEQQNYAPDMAYKLMVLFYDANKSEDENFKFIAQSFAHFVSVFQEEDYRTPYHDILITSFYHLPTRPLEFPQWKNLILQNGVRALPVFFECEKIAVVPEKWEVAQDYLLFKKYTRAEENLELARLCKKMVICEQGFNAGLDFIQDVWPKKTHDHLPDLEVEVSNETATYFWLKLPPQDYRALYLGNLIPGCCQFIHGASKDCVKDGITLSDNGFYVLLKAKNKSSTASRLHENQINDTDYLIVAQSYAWISKNNNLCLDSIEWNTRLINESVIKNLMDKFAHQVFERHPDIKHIHVGQGGQTPKKLFAPTMFSETMRQGVPYSDSRNQFRIASQGVSKIPEALKKSEDALIYLTPYLKDFDVFISELNPEFALNISKKLPKFINLIDSGIVLTDFLPISWFEYERLTPFEQKDISTFRKLWSELRLEWIPTLAPHERLSALQIMEKIYAAQLMNNIHIILALLPPEHQLEYLTSQTSFKMSLAQMIFTKPELFQKVIRTLNADNLLKLITKVEIWSNLARDNVYYQNIQTIFEKLNPHQARELLDIYVAKKQSLVHEFAYHPEILARLLSFYSPAEKLQLVKQDNAQGYPILHLLQGNEDSLKMILDLYPEEERLEALKANNNSGKSLILSSFKKPKFIEMVLRIYPPEERLTALMEKGPFKESIFMHFEMKQYLILMTLINLLPAHDVNAFLNYFKNEFVKAMQSPDATKYLIHFANTQFLLDPVASQVLLYFYQLLSNKNQGLFINSAGFKTLMKNNPKKFCSLLLNLNQTEQDILLDKFNWEGYSDSYQIHRSCLQIPNPQRANVLATLQPIPHESILEFLHIDLLRLHSLSPVSFFRAQSPAHTFTEKPHTQLGK